MSKGDGTFGSFRRSSSIRQITQISEFSKWIRDKKLSIRGHKGKLRNKSATPSNKDNSNHKKLSAKKELINMK